MTRLSRLACFTAFGIYTLASGESLAPGLLVPKIGAWQPAESAVVTQTLAEPQPGHFYLYHPESKDGQVSTHVFYSKDKGNFGLTDKNGKALHLVISLAYRVTAVTQAAGGWWLTAETRPGVFESAPLSWEPPASPTPGHAASGAIRVALFDDYGSFGKGVPRCVELLGRAPGISVTNVKPDLIREGGLTGFDVVIFTGGSGSKQAATLGLLGREQVRRFVEAGGGYIGICAGNYLACDNYSWGLKILDAKTKSSKWMRGVGDVQIELTEKGRQILGLPEGLLAIRYANGPVFETAASSHIPDFEPLAFFRTEFAKNGSPPGIQINSPAMVAGAYGKGRVLCSSPHPEQQPGMESFVEKAVRWVAQGATPGPH